MSRGVEGRLDSSPEAPVEGSPDGAFDSSQPKGTYLGNRGYVTEGMNQSVFTNDKREDKSLKGQESGFMSLSWDVGVFIPHKIANWRKLGEEGGKIKQL